MLLLSKKSFEKCRKNGMESSLLYLLFPPPPPSSPPLHFSHSLKEEEENRVLPLSKSLFVWLQPISTIQPIQSRGSFIQFDKSEKKSHFSFIHSFSNFTNCCEQADFKSPSTLLVFNNPQIKKKKQQNKFKTYFANAVEISTISTNLIKITLSQITIQKEKEWRLVSFCENC